MSTDESSSDLESNKVTISVYIVIFILLFALIGLIVFLVKYFLPCDKCDYFFYCTKQGTDKSTDSSPPRDLRPFPGSTG